MNEPYLSFEAFTQASENSQLRHFTSVGIVHDGRRFWSKKLARWLGKRGKSIRYFLDPTGPLGECAIAFKATGEFLDNVPEVGRPLAP